MKTGVTIAIALVPAHGSDTRELAQKYPEPPTKKVQLSLLCNNWRARSAELEWAKAGEFRFWHKADITSAPIHVRFLGG